MTKKFILITFALLNIFLFCCPTQASEKTEIVYECDVGYDDITNVYFYVKSDLPQQYKDTNANINRLLLADHIKFLKRYNFNVNYTNINELSQIEVAENTVSVELNFSYVSGNSFSTPLSQPAIASWIKVYRGIHKDKTLIYESRPDVVSDSIERYEYYMPLTLRDEVKSFVCEIMLYNRQLHCKDHGSVRFDEIELENISEPCSILK